MKAISLYLSTAGLIFGLSTAAWADNPQVEDLFQQGQIFASQKAYNQAQDAYLQALVLDPKHERTRISLAILYGLKKEYPKALKEIEAVQKLYPKSFLSYKVQGMLLKDSQQPEAAAKAFETYLKTAPPNQIKDRESVEKLIQALRQPAAANTGAQNP